MAGQSAYSMLSMMGATPQGTAGVPTQTFNGSNILGTPIPVVGDSKANPNYSGAVGNAVSSHHVVIIAVAIIAIGYFVFHISFEK